MYLHVHQLRVHLANEGLRWSFVNFYCEKLLTIRGDLANIVSWNPTEVMGAYIGDRSSSVSKIRTCSIREYLNGQKGNVRTGNYTVSTGHLFHHKRGHALAALIMNVIPWSIVSKSNFVKPCLWNLFFSWNVDINGTNRPRFVLDYVFLLILTLLLWVVLRPKDLRFLNLAIYSNGIFCNI